MDEHIFEVYLINKARHTEQNPVAEWVQLPTDAEKMKEVFARIGVDGIDPSEYEAAAYESPIDGLTDRFRPGESLDELNYLAALLAQRSQEEREIFAAAMIHGDHAANIADAINLTHNLDCYWLYPTVHNSEDYGHYVVDELDELELPEAAKKYFDYKAFGRDAAREDGGTFTDYGYIYNNKNDFAVWYTDHDIPKEHRITLDQPDTVFMDAAAVPQQAAAVTEPQQSIPIRPIELTATDTAGKVKEITAQLEAGVKDLFNSERYQDYLKAMSKFHDYSLNNTLLIVMQKPDASLVAGFNKWRDEFERHVKRGEKGIKILAPAPYKIKKELEKLDPDGKPIIGEDGKPVTEQKEITIPAFKVVSVFDVSQTDGKEIPDIAVDSLTGSVEQYEDFFKALEQTSPVPVGFERIESGAHGYYHNAEKRIALNEGESELQTVKTLIHEIAHAKLHDIDLNAPTDMQERPSRRTREVEAESIAYTVCQHFGLDTSDYSFGYIAGWSSDKEIKELKASLETIRQTASELITEIDGHFAQLQQQRAAAQEERPVMESLAPEQQQAIRDEVQATLQMLVDTDMQIYGEVSAGTLEAVAAQGYSYQNGQLTKAEQEEAPLAPEQTEPAPAALTELQQKAAEIAKGYQSLPMQEKIGVIAQAFGCTTGKIETSPCTGKWRGTSDISIKFDNGASLFIGNRRTPQAKTKKVQNELIDSALVSYNPEIISAAKEAATATLMQREALDNEIAAQKGLKPYTLLNVEFNNGADEKISGYMGWYYLTLAVDGKICSHIETGLHHDIANGKVSEAITRDNYFTAGALKENDVDYVFNNVGFSSTSGLYSLHISDAVRERAEKTLAERTEAQTVNLPLPDPSITVKEMNEYGYQWDGMLPLHEEAARRLFENEGVEIYRIYEDNTEGAVLSADEIREHAEQGGLFGVEKATWQRHLQPPQQEQEAVYLLDDATYLHLQTSEDGYDYTLYDRSLSEIDGGQLDNPDLSLTAARDEILALHELTPQSIDNVFLAQFEQLRDLAEQQQPQQDAPEQAAADTFTIYQIKGGEETRDYRFEPLDRLHAVGLEVQRDNYDLVYSAPLSPGETLEDIYRRFNLDHPADFTGHSLSVSDIVVLRHGDEETAHYCDSFGFTEVPEFLQQSQEAQRWNGMDGLINDKPFMPDATPNEQANALIDHAERDGQRMGNAERALIIRYHEAVQDLPKTVALINELCEQGFEQQHGHLNYLVKQRVDSEITAAEQEQRQNEPLPPSLDPAVQPVVTIIWSESDKIRDGEQMPLARADALFKALDAERRTEREQPGYDGSWYDKTKFRIDFTFHGEADNYEGRQDFGDGDGSLIDHIQAHHEYYSKDESYKNTVIHSEGKEAWEQEQAERQMILSEFVPYMRLHCNLYEQEQTAAQMLESGAELTPEQTAYFNAVLSHVDACREKLNAGDYHLPDPPQLSNFAQDPELEEYKSHVREEIAQEAAAAGMTVEEYAANGYEPREQPQPEASAATEQAQEQPEVVAVKYYPINEAAARRANDANSFRDYTPGSATAAYRQMVDQAAELAQNQKSRVDPMHHERIDQLLDTYARRLAENMNNSYAIEARVPSILIAGGSNFPVRKKEKQNAARDRNMQEWQDVQEILDKIRSTGMGGISADDPQAVAKLEAKLAKLEAAQETMKGVNAYYRKHGTLDGCTLLKPEQIKELQEGMAQSWHLDKSKPFQSFELSNNNAEIRRIRGRIEQLKQHEDKSFVGWVFDGGRVEANKTDNRLQIFFDEKPDDAARAELKANGFKWAPSAGAWQRQLNNNAYYAAGYVSCIQPITGEKPIDLQRNAQHQQAAPTPDNLLTGNQITTPRGSFHLTSMSVEQMREAGYGIHHTSDDGKYHIMGNGTQAFAVAAEQQPENYLKAAEMSTEQNYNMIDQQINNTPSVDELEEKAKRGEAISLSALAAAVKAEDGRTPQHDADGKKPSIRAQLKADQKQAAKKPTQDKEKKRSIKKDLEME